MNSPRLVLSGLSKRFGSTVALDGIDLRVDAGSVVALMGANGAGKSTLVKILSGIHASDAGRIELDGREVSPASPQDAKALGIVTVHQAIADTGVATLSVAANLLLERHCAPGARIVRSRRADEAEAAALAARIGLEIALHRRFDSLTIAEQQRVAIARALVTEPRVVIFDEPTASLSDTEAQHLFDLIDRLRARGAAILYISHRMADLERLADRAVVLRDGRVASEHARPIVFREAIQDMIGRQIDSGDARTNHEPGRTVLELDGVITKAGHAPLNLSFATREVVAVTGPVGAGKTTLAEAIFGVRALAGGAMRLDGRGWRPRDPKRAIAAGVFFAGEDRWRTSLFPSSVPFASIAGTMSFPFLGRWFPFGHIRARREHDVANAAIRRFGIKCRDAYDRLDALSGGNQQKAVIARWHVAPSRVLLLDEPFQGVDIGARDDIIRAIREEAHDRATIVFVSDYEEALEVGDRIVVLDQHALVGVYRREELDAERLLAASAFARSERNVTAAPGHAPAPAPAPAPVRQRV